MTGSMADGDSCTCKVGRVMERRGIEDIDASMADAWQRGEASLRDLERSFNEAVLGAAMRAAGRSTLDGEIENLYRLLDDDGVTAGTRTEARNRLERDGVDVGAVEADFVSHQTIHNHLRDCLGVKREASTSDPVETAENRIRSLQTRMEAVTDDAVARLREAGAVSGGEFETYVEVSIACEECGERLALGRFIENGGCACDRDPGDGSVSP